MKEKQEIEFWKKVEAWDKDPTLQRNLLRGIDAANRKMEVDSTKGNKL